MLGKNLEQALADRELTVSQLSKGANVPRTTLLGWIKGTSASPNLEQLDRVAKFLRMTIEELAFGRKQKQPELTDLLDSATVHTGLYKLTIERVVEKNKK